MTIAVLALAGALVVLPLGAWILIAVTDSDPVATVAAEDAPVVRAADATRDEIGFLTQRLALVDERQDNFNALLNLILLPLSIFVGVVAGGGLLGIVFSFRNENRSDQLHDLYVAGQSGQQARTEEAHTILLDASQKTLNLVNDTLSLSRNASAQAEQTLNRRAQTLLGEITADAESLFLRSQYEPAFKKYLLKILVEDPRFQREIANLSQRIAAIEGYLEFQEIPLSGPAFLAKGMNHHFSQDEDRAIRLLEQAARDRKAHPKVTMYAYFWAGYACNNLARNIEASELFAVAARYAEEKSPVAFELGRMQLESQFFDLSRRVLATEEGPADQDDTAEVELLLDRLSALQDEAREVKSSQAVGRVSLLIGNVSLFAWRARLGVTDALTRAEKAYKDSGEDIWSKLGRLEVKLHKHGYGALKRTELEDLLGDALEKTQKRVEPRSRTLLYLLAANSMILLGQSDDITGTMQLLRSELSQVDSLLTLYSLYWRTNVTRDQFEKWDLGEAPRELRAKLAKATGADVAKESPGDANAT